MTTYAKPQAAPFLYRVGRAKRNFIVQQGFAPSCPTTCDLQYSALLTFPLAIAASLATGAHTTAVVLQSILLAAVSAVVFGGFCLGSFLFHILRGRPDVAMRTLPWAGDAWLRTLSERGREETSDKQQTATDVKEAKDAKSDDVAKRIPTFEWQVLTAGSLW